MDYPPIYVLLTTYYRTETALKTIEGIKQNLRYPNLGFLIADDGTPGDHVSRLVDMVGPNYSLYVHDSARKGVGHGMNWGLQKTWEIGGVLTLMLEDDWLLREPFDITPHVNLLMNHEKYGMVRLGYMSAGPLAEVVSVEGRLWLEFLPSMFTYNYAGHASLRHKRLHDSVGMFSEGLAPGANELDFCAKYNATVGAPAIVWDFNYGCYGPFAHIGSKSLADVQVGSMEVID